MQKVLVTGANGFIGTSLCKELSKQHIKIIAVVREEADISELQTVPELTIVYCDISNFSRLSDYIMDRDIDVFFHFAWVGSAGILRGNTDIQIDNIRYTCDSVKACAELHCNRFVFASSIMEYEIETIMGTNVMPSISSIYSIAKLAADYMAKTLAENLGIDYLRTVISNIYGPGETSPRLINTSLRKMLKKEYCVFSSGEQLYDFIYIEDAVKAFIAIGQKGKPSRTYYIGNQVQKPLKEFLYIMRDQVDPQLPIGLGELPFNGVSLSYKEFDVFAVEQDTGFVPVVTFTEGIRRTIRWLCSEGE